MTWTREHQRLFDQLEAIDPVTAEGERRLAEREAQAERLAELARQREQSRHEQHRMRVAGARIHVRRQQRAARPDPTGLGRAWRMAMEEAA